MSNVDAVYREINYLTAEMIEIGLCLEYEFPIRNEGDVSVSGLREASAALRNRPYKETYCILREKRAFNMLLIDEALVQFRYRFRNGSLSKHVLSFYPNPDLSEYQKEPVYMSENFFAEVVREDIVPTPIRFDFDWDARKDYVHPASHCTIGQYKNCRIPVIGALTPHRFLNLILRAFYNTAYHECCADWRSIAPDFNLTVTDREKSDLHWSFEPR